MMYSIAYPLGLLVSVSAVVAQNAQNPTVRVPQDIPTTAVPSIMGVAESRTTYRLKSLTGSDAAYLKFIFTDGPQASFAWHRSVTGNPEDKTEVQVTLTERAACPVTSMVAKNCKYTFSAPPESPPEATSLVAEFQKRADNPAPGEEEEFTLVAREVTATGKAVNTADTSESKITESSSTSAASDSAVSTTSTSTASSTSTVPTSKTTSATPTSTAKSGTSADKLPMIFVPAILALGGLLSL